MSNRSNVERHPDGILFIVSGPSGAGKTSLIEHVRVTTRVCGVNLHFSVSHTTRLPRPNESDGQQYHFVDDDTFSGMVERGEFLEWANVHGKRYGTARSEVQGRLSNGEDVILDIDVQGARIIAEDALLLPHSLSVFVFPPSFEELEGRLKKRGLNSEAEIEMRLNKALHEIEHGLEFYDYVIINDDFEVAAKSLEAAIIARKLRGASIAGQLREMAERFRRVHGG